MDADDVVTRGGSRVSEAGAGWHCGTPARHAELPDGVQRFSWRHPRVLWRSRNDVIAKVFGDPSHAMRRKWVATLAERDADPAFTIVREQPEFSFLLLGDTGEGDRSQYAVVPPMLAVGADTDFMVVCSDVIYPAGELDGYPGKFFRPYADYQAPIYAIPGNHDWYDGLTGFMRVFCDVTGDAEPPPWRGPLGPLLRRLWWRPGPAAAATLAEVGKWRADERRHPFQPGPYWAVDTPSLRIVGIDTGITGGIDRDQAAWLRRVSAGDKPKLLVTGKPLYVDDSSRPGPIEGGGTIDEIVRDPDHHYVAAIGGDIHNYQRYPVPVGDRVIQYVVSGGGGAFMHATHTIPKTTVVDEGGFRCYPLRGDSLSRYSRLYGRWTRLSRLFELTPAEAARVVSHRLGMPTTRPDGGVSPRPSLRARLVAVLLGVPRRHRHRPRLLRLPVRRLPQRFRSELADWDRPPFFKNFLRVNVTETELTIRCYGVTGCGENELDPPCEDEVTISLR
ncbi:metallophosphoesterase family protein [Actinomadura craniellae]|uniref:metallophosphoesterase family protein n=1 Tax=Actinomadura craniellae TaxID=2231787 RepID=UPI001F2F53AC|nr:metallophosphoesterase [Actinomadura craniellae]